MKDKILILFSGGMDSLGALYRCLTEPQYDHLDVHVHHVHLINRLNRNKAEAIACEKIIKWLRNQGYTFEYSETTLDYSFATRLPWDTEICWSIGGMISQMDSKIKYAAAGRHGFDDDTSSNDKVLERLDKIFKYVTASEHRGYIPVEILPIVQHLSKRDIYFSLPEELREMVWWCRSPLYKDDVPEPCWNCHTCIHVRDNILN